MTLYIIKSQNTLCPQQSLINMQFHLLLDSGLVDVFQQLSELQLVVLRH